MLVSTVSADWSTYMGKEPSMCLRDARVGMHVLGMVEERGCHWRVTVFV